MVKIKAYAKINLFLDIESRREDGYHNINSIMQTVDWYDIITVSKNSENKDITIVSNNKSVPTDESNIVYKITKAFLDKCNIKSGINIHIEKNLPISAGMAGGSTDGAATLRALNELFNCPLTLEEMILLAKPIGADIPFCLVGGTKLIKGIGDIIETCCDMPDCFIVCAKDNLSSVSTPSAYKALDDLYNNFKSYTPNKNLDYIVDSIKSGDIYEISKNIFNVFEQVIEPMNASVTKIKDILIKNGAINAMMSGSGPSVFGIYKNKECAEAAVNELQTLSIDSKVCVPVSKI